MKKFLSISLNFFLKFFWPLIYSFVEKILTSEQCLEIMFYHNDAIIKLLASLDAQRLPLSRYAKEFGK